MEFLLLLIVLCALCLYFLPTFIAWRKKAPELTPIFLTVCRFSPFIFPRDSGLAFPARSATVSRLSSSIPAA